MFVYSQFFGDFCLAAMRNRSHQKVNKLKKFVLGLTTALIFFTGYVHSQAPQKQTVPSNEISAKEQGEIGDMVVKLNKSFEIAVFGYATKDTSFIVLKGVYITGFSLANDTIYVPNRKTNCSSAIASLERRIAGALCYSRQLTQLSVGDVDTLSLLLARLTLSDWIHHRKCSYLFSSFEVSRITNSTEEKQFAQYFK